MGQNKTHSLLANNAERGIDNTAKELKSQKSLCS